MPVSAYSDLRFAASCMNAMKLPATCGFCDQRVTWKPLPVLTSESAYPAVPKIGGFITPTSLPSFCMAMIVCCAPGVPNAMAALPAWNLASPSPKLRS